MQPEIVVLDGYTLNPGDLSWDAIRRYGPVTVYDRSAGQVVERAADAPLVLTNKDKLSAAELGELPKLRYIGVLATGTNIVDLDAATQRGIVVTNVPGYGADSVSQHAFGLLLELTNRVGDHARAVADGQWSACPDFCFTLAPTTELADKVLGIVGLGAIGLRVAQIGAAFGMKVAAARHGDRSAPACDDMEVPLLPLDELFQTADVVTLHCPLTAETRHVVNARRLALMKSTALLINTGRGPLVDQVALAAALRDGRIAGAGLDVLEVEPPIDDNPLIGAPRCSITPHIAWATAEARQRLLQMAAENIDAYLRGQPTNVVNPQVLDRGL